MIRRSAPPSFSVLGNGARDLRGIERGGARAGAGATAGRRRCSMIQLLGDRPIPHFLAKYVDAGLTLDEMSLIVRAKAKHMFGRAKGCASIAAKLKANGLRAGKGANTSAPAAAHQLRGTCLVAKRGGVLLERAVERCCRTSLATATTCHPRSAWAGAVGTVGACQQRRAKPIRPGRWGLQPQGGRRHRDDQSLRSVLVHRSGPRGRRL